MHLAQNATEIIKNYRVHNTQKFNELNTIYTVSQVSSPQSNPLFILKKYGTALGYQQEKRVFQIENLYQGYFVQAFTLPINGNHHLHFTVCKHSNSGSLIELGKTIKQFPLQIAKFYLHSLLSKLKRVHSTINTPYRTIYHSDLIFSGEKQIYIVGWSKTQEQITEELVILDCAEIFYYMITNGVFQNRGTRRHIGQYNFLDQKFWNISKHKHSYLKHFPKDQTQLKRLVNFFKKMTIKTPDATITIQQLLSDPFFDDIIQFEVASQRLNQIQSHQTSQQKEKVLKDLDRKIRIKKTCKQEEFKKIESQVQSSATRGLNNIAVLQSQDYDQQGYIELLQQVSVELPFLIRISKNEPNETKKQGQKEKNKKIFNPQMMGQLICSYLDSNLKKNKIGYQIFEQEWIEANFQVKIVSQTQGLIKYEIQCNMSFTKSEQTQREIQKYVFQLTIQLNNQIPHENCIKEFRLNHINQQLNQILFYKLEDYLTKDLNQLMMYTDC